VKKTTRVPLASLFNTSFGVISSLVAATALISSCAPAPNSENTGTGDISFPIPEIHSLQAIIGSYPPIQASSPASGFESLYENSGQPKFNFIKSVSKRFGGRLNKGVSPSSLTPTEREKWQKIFAEIVKVADRNALTPKSLLEIDASLAMQWSIALETTGAISDTGASNQPLFDMGSQIPPAPNSCQKWCASRINVPAIALPMTSAMGVVMS